MSQIEGSRQIESAVIGLLSLCSFIAVGVGLAQFAGEPAPHSSADRSHQRVDKPMFEEVSVAALGANSALLQQFGLGTGYGAEHLDAASGIDFYGLNGAVAGDYDGDGWDDFYVCQPGGLPGRLLRNRRDGTFEDVTATAGVGLLDVTSAALFGDYDNDGDQDLLLVTASGILLLESDGRGRFTRSTRARFNVPANEQGSMMMPALADYDRDGFLDLYVCLYSLRSNSGMAKYLHQPTPYFDAENGAPNHLFRNNGDGSFSDVTSRSGLSTNNTRWSFAASWGDYNRDGYPDLYVANDFGRNNLYRNNGDGTFTDVAAHAGVEDIGAGMSVAWGDLDNDGFDDLYVSNIWSAAGQRAMALPEFQPGASPAMRESMRRFAMGNSLYRNRGDGTFERAGNETANGGWAWGSDFLDADNDGWEDLLIVNGHITNDREDDLESFHWTDLLAASPLRSIQSRSYEEAWRQFQKRISDGWSVHGKERKRFYRNTGSGRFADFSAPSGLDFQDDGRSFALLDFDNDGDLDVVLKNRTAPQVRVLRNNSASTNYSVALELVGRKSNRDAVGARATFTLAGKTRTKEVRSGSGFLSQHTRRLYFGVGSARELPGLRIDWPSGISQEFTRVPTGTLIRIEEGRSDFVVRPFRRTQDSPGTERRLIAEAPRYRGTWLMEPIKMPDLGLSDRIGKTPVAVSVDQANRTVLMSATGEASDPYVASPSAIRLLCTVATNLFARRREMKLPLTLLLDGQGRIVKIYREYVSREWISEDLRQIPAYERDRNSIALPFPGQYAGVIGNRLEAYFLIGLESLQAGLHENALDYFEQCLRLDYGLAAVHSNIASIRARQGRLDEALKTFGRAKHLDPQSAEIQFNIGTTLAMAGRYREGAAALEEAAKMDPGSAETWTNLGNVYMDLDEAALARPAFERALALLPGSAMVHNSLGTLYYQQRSPDLARKHFQESIRLQPDYESAYLNLGLLYLNQQDREQAAAMFGKALELNPANAEAKRLLERTQ